MYGYDSIPLKSEKQAIALVRKIESKVNFKGWIPCRISFVEERRHDRVADCTLDMHIRLFEDGQNVGSLLHEMAHNSINCLMDLIMATGLKLLTSGRQHAHAAHFELMLEFLVRIYESSQEEECSQSS